VWIPFIVLPSLRGSWGLGAMSAKPLFGKKSLEAPSAQRGHRGLPLPAAKRFIKYDDRESLKSTSKPSQERQDECQP